MTHGDLFDGVVQQDSARLAFAWRTSCTRLILALNHLVQSRPGRRLGFGYWSLSQYLKHKAKEAPWPSSPISSWRWSEGSASAAASDERSVCRPYPQGGDSHGRWSSFTATTATGSRSLTALVEDYSGQLRIVEWKEIRQPTLALETAMAK